MLKHEALHYLKGDTFIKYISTILYFIYWWNPVVYLLRKKLPFLIEVKNDAYLVKEMDDSEKKRYMLSMLGIFKKIKCSKSTHTTAFINTKYNEFKKRFECILISRQKIKMGTLAFTFLCCFVLCTTTLYTWEDYKPPSDSYIRLSPDNTYVVKHNGEYQVFYHNKFFYSTDSLEYLPKEIPIREEK